jgi:hypothetical protein
MLIPTLGSLPNELEFLCLQGNPLVSKMSNYRQSIIAALPNLVELDNQEVTLEEKLEAGVSVYVVNCCFSFITGIFRVSDVDTSGSQSEDEEQEEEYGYIAELDEVQNEEGTTKYGGCVRLYWYSYPCAEEDTIWKHKRAWTKYNEI